MGKKVQTLAFKCAPLLIIGVVLVYLYGFWPVAKDLNALDRSLLELWFINCWIQPDWQHGLIVPIIIGIIIYRRRSTFLLNPHAGCNLAWPLLPFAFFTYWLGVSADIHYIGWFSLQILLGAMALWFFGWNLLRPLLPLLFISLFMWPMPFLEGIIAFPLRILMSLTSHHFLNMLGFSNLLIGTAIVSVPDFANNLAQGARFALDVADPCSGIRSLFAMLMISSLYGYLAFGSKESVMESSSIIQNPKSKIQNLPAWFLMLLVFLSAIPLVILGNMARILLLAFGTILWGVEFAVGTIDHPTWFHEGAGFLVYAVELIGLWAMVTVLENIQRLTNKRSELR